MATEKVRKGKRGKEEGERKVRKETRKKTMGREWGKGKMRRERKGKEMQVKKWQKM